MGRTLLLFVLLSTIGLAHAQNMPEDARAVYDGTAELPDSLAFVSTMQVLATMNGIDNASPALDLIQRGMGLTPTEAREVLDQLLVAYQAFGDDRKAYTKEVLCPTEWVGPNGDDIYQAFEAIDDADEWLGSRHLQEIKAELGDDKAARLEQWLQSRKYNVTYVKVRYKSSYERAGRSPELAREKICSALASEAR